MNLIEEIQKTIAIFDPDFKNEDEENPEDTSINIENYQKAIDSAVDPEDLNFSMDNLFDAEDSEEEEVEQLTIPQHDYEENPIKIGDSVQRITRDSLTGKVLAVGELVEVEWNPELITLEYPEELIHVEDNDDQEQEKITSLETIPPTVLKSPNT